MDRRPTMQIGQLNEVSIFINGPQDAEVSIDTGASVSCGPQGNIADLARDEAESLVERLVKDMGGSITWASPEKSAGRWSILER